MAYLNSSFFNQLPNKVFLGPPGRVILGIEDDSKDLATLLYEVDELKKQNANLVRVVDALTLQVVRLNEMEILLSPKIIELAEAHNNVAVALMRLDAQSSKSMTMVAGSGKDVLGTKASFRETLVRTDETVEEVRKLKERYGYTIL